MEFGFQSAEKGTGRTLVRQVWKSEKETFFFFSFFFILFFYSFFAFFYLLTWPNPDSKFVERRWLNPGLEFGSRERNRLNPGSVGSKFGERNGPNLGLALPFLQTRNLPWNLPFSQLQTSQTRVWPSPFSEFQTCQTRFCPVLSLHSEPAEPGLYLVFSPNYEPAEPGLTQSNFELKTQNSRQNTILDHLASFKLAFGQNSYCKGVSKQNSNPLQVILK